MRGLAGIPTEGPVLLVGYHMLMGLELYPLVKNFVIEKNILLRGLAHPMLFARLNEDQVDLSAFDTFRLMGAVPVTASNFYKLLSSGSHVLLYPGGMREALHKRVFATSLKFIHLGFDMVALNFKDHSSSIFICSIPSGAKLQ